MQRLPPTRPPALPEEVADYLEGLMEGFVVYDAGWRMTYMNAAAEHLLRRKREDVLGKRWHEAFPHAVGNPVDDMYQRVMRGRVSERLELFYEHYGRWLEISASPVRTGGIAVYFRDSTERREAEERLRQSEERFSKAFSASPDGLVISSESEGTIGEANEALLSLLGLRREEILGKKSSELGLFTNPSDRERALGIFREEGRLRDYEMTLRTRSGELHTVLLSVEGIEARGQRSLLTIVRDITEAKRMEQTLREAHRRKDEFLAMLAHELRNPLAPIRNAVQLLKRQGPPEPALQHAHDVIERQVQHMVRLIEDLLDVSRITRGKLALRKARVALATVIEQALETSRPHLEHELTVALPPAPVLLEADPVRLAEVFSNLLNNAAQYTAKGGRIWLSAERHDAHLTVTVGDTGIGIPREQLSRVFEMFSQVAPPLERTHGGLGIGLALARALAEMHGGSIEARSEGIGKGSEFVVRLPVLDDPAATAPAQAKKLAPRPEVVPRRILVVEDNVDAAQSLAMLLRLEGSEVETAYDGEAAVSKADASRPDAILLDIGLPKTNGYDACRAIRAQPWARNVPIIALTGWGQDEDRRRSREAGFDGHLVKPVEHAALMSLLASLLTRPP